MTISSAGIGSNLNVESIVSQLLTIDKQPITVLDSKTASFQAKLSGFGTLKSVLSQFQSALSSLSDISKFQGVKTNVADATIASASGSSIAVPGSYSLEVSKLAQAQKLNAAGQTTSTAAIGANVSTTLSFDFGTISNGTLGATDGKYTGAAFASNGAGVKTVTIDGSNNSLSGIRDAINKANVGVTATIVNDGSNTPFRLSLTVNAPGKSNSLKLSVAGDAAISSLLSHDPSANAGQALSETSTAQNAVFKLDGIEVTKTTNSVSDAVAGVTLNLAKTNVGAPTTITVARDTSTVVASVNSFVKSYNDISKALQDATAYNATTKQGAILNGEASVRIIQNQIRSALGAPVTGGASTFTLLSQVGVTVQKDGSLGVDSTKLQTAVDTNFSQIAGLFASAGKSSDSLIAYTGATAKTSPGAYPVNVSQLATRGTSTAASAAGLTITAGNNDSLTVMLDGISSNVTLGPGTYASAAALATEIQSKINGNSAFGSSKVAVTESSGKLTITSSTYGAQSRAEITGGDGQANLKFDTGATVIAGLNTVGTINGVPGVGSGQLLLGATGDASEGLSIQIAGGSLGNRGIVNFSQGYAFKLNKLATTLLSAEGPIASRTTGINASIKDIAKTKEALNARLTETEKRYRAQFTALDSVISKMSTTSSFLTQQLANLPKSS